MRSERWIPALLLLCLTLSLRVVPQESPKGKPSAPPARDSRPLVRKDLLVLGRGEIKPPRRDIFRPRSYAEPTAPQLLPANPAARNGQAAPAKTAPSFALELVYVGSIRSAGKITALVMRDGQTLPVAEGDEIIPGYKVLRITADEIEVEGPNSQRKTFSRQGDRP
jgi:hypothetical protein